MKKKAIIIFIGIILICSITLFLSAFFSGKDSDKLGEDTTRTTENGQAEDLDIDSEEEKESETIGENAAALIGNRKEKEVQKIHQQIPRWIWERNNRQRTLIMR